MILRHSEKLSLRRPLYELRDHSELKLTSYAAIRERNGLIKDWDEEQNHAD